MIFDRLFRRGESAQPGNTAAAGGKKQANSSRKDLIRTVTAIGTFAKKNRYYLFFPGTLKADDKVEVITAILITRSKIYGISCYGFGGVLEARPGGDDWVQTLNGQRTRIPSPAVKNEQRRQFLEMVLEKARLSDIPVSFLGVFTSPTVTVTGANGTGCYTENEFIELLQNEQHYTEETIDVKSAAQALEPYIYREEENAP